MRTKWYLVQVWDAKPNIHPYYIADRHGIVSYDPSDAYLFTSPLEVATWLYDWLRGGVDRRKYRVEIREV